MRLHFKNVLRLYYSLFLITAIPISTQAYYEPHLNHGVCFQKDKRSKEKQSYYMARISIPHIVHEFIGLGKRSRLNEMIKIDKASGVSIEYLQFQPITDSKTTTTTTDAWYNFSDYSAFKKNLIKPRILEFYVRIDPSYELAQDIYFSHGAMFNLNFHLKDPSNYDQWRVTAAIFILPFDESSQSEGSVESQQCPYH